MTKLREFCQEGPGGSGPDDPPGPLQSWILHRRARQHIELVARCIIWLRNRDHHREPVAVLVGAVVVDQLVCPCLDVHVQEIRPVGEAVVRRDRRVPAVSPCDKWELALCQDRELTIQHAVDDRCVGEEGHVGHQESPVSLLSSERGRRETHSRYDRHSGVQQSGRSVRVHARHLEGPMSFRG
jgi:hypothetical protein